MVPESEGLRKSRFVGYTNVTPRVRTCKLNSVRSTRIELDVGLLRLYEYPTNLCFLLDVEDCPSESVFKEIIFNIYDYSRNRHWQIQT